jgi:hypothetical protein
MVLVGMLCVMAAWVASERRVVLARHAMLAKWRGDPTVSVRMAAADLNALRAAKLSDPQSIQRLQRVQAQLKSVSWARRLMGDQAISQISFKRAFRGPVDPRTDAAHGLFPEARIYLGRRQRPNPELSVP